MANVEKYLQQILSARYGKDVRQSIHDSINEINIQVTESETSALNSAQAAATSSESAAESATSAANSLQSIGTAVSDSQTAAQAAQESAANAATSETNAKESETAAKESEVNAKESETAAKESETNAKESETAAATSANNALISESNAATSETTASNAAETATTKATEASTSATNAGNYADLSQSYAVGGTGTRIGEDTDNAKYYKEQAQQIAGGLAGGFVPMGTIPFSELANQSAQAGYMYNISDDFTSDDTFKDGAGIDYPAGTNVYYTADNLWDCLTGASVLGIKGNAESTYRRGMVNITPENVGAVATDGDTAENTVAFTSNDVSEPTEWTDVDLLSSGEKHSSILLKLSTMFKNIRFLYKMLGTTDISAIGDGTVTNALSTLNGNLIDNYPLKTQISNPNLLDNPWFTVNQRGITKVSAFSYFADRWISTACEIVDGKVSLPSNKFLYQRFPIDYLLENREYTISVLLDNMEVVSATIPYSTTFAYDHDGDIRFEFQKGTNFGYIGVCNTGTENVSIIAVKLELGTISTLANDVAPNYQQELAKCQRYYQLFNVHSQYYYPTACFNSTEMRMGMDLFVPMVRKPDVSFSDFSAIEIFGNGSALKPSEFSVGAYNMDTHLALVFVVDNGTANSSYLTKINTSMYLSADL